MARTRKSKARPLTDHGGHHRRSPAAARRFHKILSSSLPPRQQSPSISFAEHVEKQQPVGPIGARTVATAKGFMSFDWAVKQHEGMLVIHRGKTQFRLFADKRDILDRSSIRPRLLFPVPLHEPAEFSAQDIGSICSERNHEQELPAASTGNDDDSSYDSCLEDPDLSEDEPFVDDDDSADETYPDDAESNNPADKVNQGNRFRLSPNDRARIRANIADQWTQDDAIIQEKLKNPDSARRAILADLGYNKVFTNWLTVLLDLAADSMVKLGAKGITARMNTLSTRPPSVGSQPVGALLNSPDDTWSNDDDAITEQWVQRICPAIQSYAGDDFDIRTLNKPSGSLQATLSILLHYATFNTARPHGGSTFDPSNPCIDLVRRKLGDAPAVKVQNRYMARHRYQEKVSWSTTFKNWSSMKKEFLDFNRWLNRDSRILILMGRKNCNISKLNKLVDLNANDEVCRIELDVPFRMYSERPFFVIVRDMTTQEIKHLIFRSYHPMTFFHMVKGGQGRGAYHDLIFNTACELANVTPASETTFMHISRRGQSSLGRELQILRQLEKQNGLLDEDVVRNLVPDFIAQYPEHFTSGFPKSATGSYVGGILALCLEQNLERGRATQAANGFPSLKRGLATNRANEFPSLKRGLATQEANGFPSLKRGLATNRANEFPNLIQGRATQEANGFPSLKRGLATSKARGYPQLAKSRETSKARGYPELVKGRATQKARGHPELVKGRATSKAQGWPALKRGLATCMAQGSPALKRGHKTQSANAAKVRKAKVLAVLKVKQVRDFLEFQGYMTEDQKKRQDEMRNRLADPGKSWGSNGGFLRRVKFWKPKNPQGLRWVGDGCETEDTFDYMNKQHPAVRACFF